MNTSWLAAAGVTVTLAVCTTAMPFTVADTLFDAATVELSVPVATPVASVTPLGCVRTFPDPDAASATVTPATGFPKASRAATEMVDVVTPALAAIAAGLALTVDSNAETGPAVTVMAPDVAAVSPVVVTVRV